MTAPYDPTRAHSTNDLTRSDWEAVMTATTPKPACVEDVRALLARNAELVAALRSMTAVAQRILDAYDTESEAIGEQAVAMARAELPGARAALAAAEGGGK